MASSTEIVADRNLTKVDLRHWKGNAYFFCANSVANAVADGLWNTAFPGFTGDFTPMCNGAKANFDVKPGQAVVHAQYLTPRDPLIARLFYDVSYESRPLWKDKDDKATAGADPVNPLNDIVIIKGEITETIPRVILKLEMAQEDNKFRPA